MWASVWYFIIDTGGCNCQACAVIAWLTYLWSHILCGDVLFVRKIRWQCSGLMGLL
jgi:hypothetical protein